MTTRRTFFVVFDGMAGPTFTLYHDDLPSEGQLRVLPAVLYRREITGTRWAVLSLSEIIAEYETRRAAGELPPDNTIKSPAAKAKTTIGRPERPWTVGELALDELAPRERA